MPETRPPLVFLKLGGALITDKASRNAVRHDLLERLAVEVAAWSAEHPHRLVLAHGSGSFAHVAAVETHFLERPADPMAYAKVTAAARALNAHVVNALIRAGCPAVGVPGSLLVRLEDGRVADCRLDLVTDLLDGGILPVTFGDAALDTRRGAGIASTETLVVALAERLPTQRIVLATDVEGVFPGAVGAGSSLAEITPTIFRDLDRAWGTPAWQSGDASRSSALGHGPGAPAAPTHDVTGAMRGKVLAMLDLVQRVPAIDVRIVTGKRPGIVPSALSGAPDAAGTLILADPDE